MAWPWSFSSTTWPTKKPTFLFDAGIVPIGVSSGAVWVPVNSAMPIAVWPLIMTSWSSPFMSGNAFLSIWVRATTASAPWVAGMPLPGSSNVASLA